MKKFFCLLFIFSVITGITFAIELEGGVSFNVDSAKKYIQEGLPDEIEINQPKYFDKDDPTIQKVVFSYNNEGKVIGITVQYKNEPAKAYIYGKSKHLIYIEQYDKPVNIYPHRGYRYNLDGTLNLTSLTVSKNEMFRFTPNGKLLAHSLNGIIYDENGEVIGSGK